MSRLKEMKNLLINENGEQNVTIQRNQDPSHK